MMNAEFLLNRLNGNMPSRTVTKNCSTHSIGNSGVICPLEPIVMVGRNYEASIRLDLQLMSTDQQLHNTNAETIRYCEPHFQHGTHQIKLVFTMFS